MSLNHSKLSIATAFTIIASFALLLAFAGPGVWQRTSVTRIRSRCTIRAQLPLAVHTVLGQTFIPSAPGQRVCQVKLVINKNLAGAGNLTLRLVRSNFTPLDAGVTIPGSRNSHGQQRAAL